MQAHHAANSPDRPDRILRWRETCERIGVSRTTLWRMINRGAFPAPIPLSSPAAVGWIEREVEDWLKQRAAARPTRRTA
jgi:prophage regulatory protein